MGIDRVMLADPDMTSAAVVTQWTLDPFGFVGRKRVFSPRRWGLGAAMGAVSAGFSRASIPVASRTMRHALTLKTGTISLYLCSSAPVLQRDLIHDETVSRRLAEMVEMLRACSSARASG